MNDISEDEMECDFIRKPNSLLCFPEEVHFDDEGRPQTPPNSSSSPSISELSFSPVGPSHANSESGFYIRKAGLDRNLFNRHKLKYTSTPRMINMTRMSNTLPPDCNVSDEMTQLRQCKSVEHVRQLKCGSEQIPYEYVNPFTPDGKLIINKNETHKKFKRLSINPVRKFDLSDSTESDSHSNTEIDMELPIRPRLSEFNVSRFNEEFVQLKEIGKGVHGCVFKCLNRMNGCLYAIKRTIKPVRSSLEERIIRNEIYAHGILDHQNIVRNYSCWTEEGFVFIQNEYCNGGSLEDYIKSNVISEAFLRSLLLQMGQALSYLHKKGLAHMDVKPGNILLCIDKISSEENNSNSVFRDDYKSEEIVFKLGDLGHVTKLDEREDVEEGDCRYLSREVLEEKYTNLDRADIFSLGLTVYEAAGVSPLPKNGDEWQEIRNGNLKYLNQYSEEFNKILKSMVHPSPELRPSASELVETVTPSPSSPPQDLFSYLQHYRYNSQFLEKKVETAGQYLKVLFHSHKQLQDQLNSNVSTGSSGREKVIAKKKGAISKTRVVGKKTKRSSSTVF
ncbi:Mitosis inhibitor protein kinase wee1 [Homalodisca vitripennis]|nr:Mitosis inhibitor protein kinase wee1 [Homalodisca vitripennis]